MNLEKRAEDLADEYAVDRAMGDPVEAMLQLAREFADARAEEIALECERRATCAPNADAPTVYRCAAAIARAMTSKARTREDVLAEALRWITELYTPRFPDERAEVIMMAQERAKAALEWKP